MFSKEKISSTIIERVIKQSVGYKGKRNYLKKRSNVELRHRGGRLTKKINYNYAMKLILFILCWYWQSTPAY